MLTFSYHLLCFPLRYIVLAFLLAYDALLAFMD